MTVAGQALLLVTKHKPMLSNWRTWRLSHKAIHQLVGGAVRPSVDVCSSSNSSSGSIDCCTSLLMLLVQLLLWQLSDDNRWRTLITSSWREMNSYPASLLQPLPPRRRRRERLSLQAVFICHSIFSVSPVAVA